MSFEIDGSFIFKDSSIPSQSVGIKEREAGGTEFENVLKESINEREQFEHTDNAKIETEKIDDTNPNPSIQEPPDQPEVNQDKKTKTENEQNNKEDAVDSEDAVSSENTVDSEGAVGPEDTPGLEGAIGFEGVVIPEDAVDPESNLIQTESFVDVDDETKDSILPEEKIVDLNSDGGNILLKEISAVPVLGDADKSVDRKDVPTVVTDDLSEQGSIESKDSVVTVLAKEDVQTEIKIDIVENPSSPIESNGDASFDGETVLETNLNLKGDIVSDNLPQEAVESQGLEKKVSRIDENLKIDKNRYQADKQNKSNTDLIEQNFNVSDEKKGAKSLAVEDVPKIDRLDDPIDPVKNGLIVEEKPVERNQAKKVVKDEKIDPENKLIENFETREIVSENMSDKRNGSGENPARQQSSQFLSQEKLDLNIENDISKETTNLNEPIQSNKESFQTDLDSKLVEKEIASKRFEDIEELQKSVNDQIKAQLKVSKFGEINRSEIKFSLKPEHLGELSMKLTMENNNLTARIKVESQVVKEVLELNIDDLRKNLMDQGVKVEKVEVTLKNDTGNMGSLDDRANKENIAKEKYFSKNEKYTEKYKKENDDLTGRVTRKMESRNGRIDYLI